jgi:hypothetical protein
VPDLLDDDVREFLEGGSSTIVGFVTADGVPFATRGWGSQIVGPAELRVLVGAGPLVAGGRGPILAEPFAIAVTGADVRTLHSVQAKGVVVALEPPTAEDLERSARFCDEFFTAVRETDGIERERMDRLVPDDLLACTVEVDELYDQTPGPGAGARLAR